MGQNEPKMSKNGQKWVKMGKHDAPPSPFQPKVTPNLCQVNFGPELAQNGPKMAQNDQK